MALLLTAILPLVAQASVARQEVMLGDRSYLVDLPTSAAGAPMILVLHGGGGNAAQIARNSGIGAPATAQGYAVIYPQGTSRVIGLATWNAGKCCGLAVRRDVDDVRFLDQVIADAAKRFGLDASAVFLTGMSNGAMMAERYAATRPGAVRAVAAVAGTLDVAAAPVRGRVALLQIHGTADTHVPYAGGVGPDSPAGVNFTAVDVVVAAFVAAQKSTLTRDARVIDPEPDGMRVLQTDWVDADGQVRVRLLTVEGGGHDWPGGERAARRGGTRDIDATAEILHFFSLHR